MDLLTLWNNHSDITQNNQNIDHESRSPTGLGQPSGARDHDRTSDHAVWHDDTAHEHPGMEHFNDWDVVLFLNSCVRTGMSQRQMRKHRKRLELAHAYETVKEKMAHFAECLRSKQRPSALPQASMYKNYFTKSFWSELEEVHRRAELSYFKSLSETRFEEESLEDLVSDSDTTTAGLRDTSKESPRESVSGKPSPVFKFSLPGRSKPLKLGLPIGHKAPIAPVDMSWRGRPEPKRYNPDLHRDGKPFKNGQANEGTIFFGTRNMRVDEHLRLCHVIYCRPDKFCSYLAPVKIKGVWRMVRCANNHQLTQEQLNEMFYGRRITLTDAARMVDCNKAQPHPRPPFFVPLHVPDAPPGYDESKWVIEMFPGRSGKELLKEAPQYIDDPVCSTAPLDLRYTRASEAAGTTNPTATLASAVRCREAVYFEYRDQVISDILIGRYADDYYPGDEGERSLADFTEEPITIDCVHVNSTASTRGHKASLVCLQMGHQIQSLVEDYASIPLHICDTTFYASRCWCSRHTPLSEKTSQKECGR